MVFPSVDQFRIALCAVLLGVTGTAPAVPGTAACKDLSSQSAYLACLHALAKTGEKAVGMTPGQDHRKIGAVQVWTSSAGRSRPGRGTLTCTKHGAVIACTTAQ